MAYYNGRQKSKRLNRHGRPCAGHPRGAASIRQVVKKHFLKGLS
jgi:hypothetical protein